MFKNKFIRRSVIAIIVIAIALFFIKQENMTLKQSIVKIFYPVIMLGKSKDIQKNTTYMQPPISFYSLHTLDNKGSDVNFEQFRGKKILLVNTASDCGFTPQYEDLEKLYQQYKNKLVIIAFPANDFGEQEKGSDDEVAGFCKINYGVTFPLMKKSVVIKTTEQNEIFRWLTDKSKNGWNEQEPTWNFCKYLIDENGTLISIYNSSVSPMNKEITDAIN